MLPTSALFVLRSRKPQVGLRRYNTNSIRMAHSATPALNTDYRVTGRNDLELECFFDTPFQPAIDVLLPDLHIEVGLLFGEVKRVDAAVEVRILYSNVV